MGRVANRQSPAHPLQTLCAALLQQGPKIQSENIASRLKRTSVSEQTLKETCFHVEDNLSLTPRCFFDAQTAKGMKTRSKPDRQA